MIPPAACRGTGNDPGDVLVLVFGDMILDRYCFGDVERISPEAPVPVLRVTHEKYILGGAGNVVSNLRGLGAAAFPVGLVGNDAQGVRILDLLSETGVAREGIHVSGVRPTSQKTRMVSGRQQMVRMDTEETFAASPEESSALVAAFRAALPRCSAVILSDYGKGTCSPANCRAVIEEALSAGVPVIVDPKGPDWEKYRGASWVTPNLKELAEASGLAGLPNDDDEVARAGRDIRVRYGIPHLLVTRSEAGMTLLSDEGELHVRSVAREVFDVSGAGDTVVAVLAAFLGCGLPAADAVGLANVAAGIVVGKSGTRPILAAELDDAADGRNRRASSAGKILGEEDAVGRVREWKKEGLKVSATNGCFDILHPGHVACLEDAAAYGDRLVVALNSDGSVRRLKGPGRPVNPESARARVLAGLSSVDLIVIFGEDTPDRIYGRMRPDVVCKGGDYAADQVAGGESAGRVVIIPMTEGFSTSGIVERIKGENTGTAGGNAD